MATNKDPIAKEISSFFKQAVSVFDEVKDSVLAGGQATKATVDTQLLKRTRERTLARLGEVLLEEIARGAAVPAACDAVVKEIHDLDAQILKAKAESEKLWKAAEGKGADDKAGAARAEKAEAKTDDDDDE